MVQQIDSADFSHSGQLANIPVRNLQGERFGRWVVLSFAGRTKDSRSLWLCRCDCGTERNVMTQSLVAGVSQSCGCLTRETTSKRCKKHGLHARNSKVYRVWAGMKQRCLNPKNKRYSDYGGRGINICERWMVFLAFLADMGEPSEDQSIDRKNNGEGYHCGKCDECIHHGWTANCKWSTGVDQQNNIRSNHFIEFQGKRQTIAQWEREKGFKAGVVRSRLAEGWSIERALTQASISRGE